MPGLLLLLLSTVPPRSGICAGTPTDPMVVLKAATFGHDGRVNAVSADFYAREGGAVVARVLDADEIISGTNGGATVRALPVRARMRLPGGATGHALTWTLGSGTPHYAVRTQVRTVVDKSLATLRSMTAARSCSLKTGLENLSVLGRRLRVSGQRGGERRLLRGGAVRSPTAARGRGCTACTRAHSGLDRFVRWTASAVRTGDAVTRPTRAQSRRVARARARCTRGTGTADSFQGRRVAPAPNAFAGTRR
jgi:hypothetical protein